jgi:Tfp pilus assembly pilus retraction ATPase PilT
MNEVPSSLRKLLETLVQRAGSDLFLVVGLPPASRINGIVQRLETDPLEEADIDSAVLPVLPAHAIEQYRKSGCSGSSLRFDGIGRFRINMHRERGRPAATFRALAARPPRFSELNLPSNILALTRIPYGLVLVGGPTGSGKTTTLAALVDEINRKETKHIITIEDPIFASGNHDHAFARLVFV